MKQSNVTLMSMIDDENNDRYDRLMDLKKTIQLMQKYLESQDTDLICDGTLISRMIKYFTAYKVQFTRAELGLKAGDMLGNPMLMEGNGKPNKYLFGSIISEEDEDDDMHSTRSN